MKLLDVNIMDLKIEPISKIKLYNNIVIITIINLKDVIINEENYGQ
jgi:hypothetical protein